jgi:hypothetical protein
MFVIRLQASIGCGIEIGKEKSVTSCSILGKCAARDGAFFYAYYNTLVRT